MTTPTSDTGPQLRLLYCFQCKSIEELPPFEGRPENDHLLEISLEKHRGAEGEHTGHLFTVPVKHWASPNVRKEIIKQIREGAGGLNDLDPDYYDTKSQFALDAGQCYEMHLRPKGRCPDWKIDRKRLLPKTSAERKEVGLPTPGEAPGPKTYLCDFCIAKSYMMTRARDEAGLYE